MTLSVENFVHFENISSIHVIVKVVTRIDLLMLISVGPIKPSEKKFYTYLAQNGNGTSRVEHRQSVLEDTGKLLVQLSPICVIYHFCNSTFTSVLTHVL
jgi:hypothetical protein